MKLNKGIFFSIPSLLSLFAMPAAANTTLPYFGSDQKDCGVIQPRDMADSDGGYHTSEDCKYIYVLPPAHSVFKLARPGYAYNVDIRCPMIERAEAEIAKPLDDPNATDAQKYQYIMDRIGWLNRLDRTLERSYPEVAAVVSGSASLGWNKMVNAYRRANKDNFRVSESSFVQMPIRIGALSVVNPVIKQDELGVVRGGMLKYSTVAGQEFSEEARNSLKSLSLPGLWEMMGPGSVIMGQAVGVQLGFNMRAACLMHKSIGERLDPSAFLAGTYTYIYPIQTKARFSISFNEDEIRTRISQFFTTHKGAFTVDDIKASFGGERSGAVEIKIWDGAFAESEMGKKIAENYKDALLTKVTEYMMVLLAENANISIAQNTSVVLDHHSSHSCSRSGLFGWKKSCSTTTWVTSRNVIDWPGVIRDLSSRFKAPSGNVVEYKSYYNFGTTAITPKFVSGDDLN